MGVGKEVDGKGNRCFVCWFSFFARNALWELHFVIVFCYSALNFFAVFLVWSFIRRVRKRSENDRVYPRNHHSTDQISFPAP